MYHAKHEESDFDIGSGFGVKMRTLGEGFARFLENFGIPFELGTLIICGGLLILGIYLNYK